MDPNIHYTPEEMMITAIANEIVDGALVVEGLNTFLPSVGYRLAKLTHAPNCVFLGLGASVYLSEAVPLSITFEEPLQLEHAIGYQNSSDAPLYNIYRFDVEMFRSAQIDPFGNVNSTVIGDYSNPVIRLPGITGVADAFTHCDHIRYYFPRHTKRVFVEKLDFLSAFGFGDGSPNARSDLPGQGPYKVITNLGVFGFERQTKRMELISIHPGVTRDEIVENTSFEMLFPDEIPVTEPPSAEQLELIRTRIDPLNIRSLESATGEERFKLLQSILKEEERLLTSGEWKEWKSK